MKNIVKVLLKIAAAIRGPSMRRPSKPVIEMVMGDAGSIDVYWKSNPELDNVIGYRVFRDRSEVYAVNGPLPLELRFSDDDVEDNVEYMYHVVAVNYDGEESRPSDLAYAQTMAF